MSVFTKDGVTTIEQKTFVVPDLTVKDLLSAIPAHCFKRSALKSSLYIVADVIGLACVYSVGNLAQYFLDSYRGQLPHPAVYTIARFSIWSLYGFAAGLLGTGLWVIAHECGHQAFSESKFLNNSVGWILHSALGVPYHSWRITHGKHHASTGHMTQDQVFVPKTRTQWKRLPAFDPENEDVLGASIKDKARLELVEALGDSPLGFIFGAASYLLIGWPAYLIRNASGQRRYPKGTNHFSPSALMFAPHQYRDIVVSDIGILLWLGGLVTWTYYRGLSEVVRLYLVPYIWVNHWLVIITFLQHTDPLLPHYRAGEFTFSRGALCTLDRQLFGDLGPVAAWIGAAVTHGISETHVVHHTSSKIPHYNAWEAREALNKVLKDAGYNHDGGAVGWAEMYRVFRACRFVEDEGQVVFYKNSHGLAAARAVFSEKGATDSGVEMSK